MKSILKKSIIVLILLLVILVFSLNHYYYSKRTDDLNKLSNFIAMDSILHDFSDNYGNQSFIINKELAYKIIDLLEEKNGVSFINYSDYFYGIERSFEFIFYKTSDVSFFISYDALSKSSFFENNSQEYHKIGIKKYISSIFGFWLNQRINNISKFNYIYSNYFIGDVKGLNNFSLKYYQKGIEELSEKELSTLFNNLGNIAFNTN